MTSSDTPIETRFRSRSEHNLDTKGRLNIPSRFREVLQAEYDGRLIVTNWHRCLKAYPETVWASIEMKLLEARNQPGMDALYRYVISGVTECQLDRQGRILVPPALRAELGIDKEIMINGMLDHFEIWDKSTWEQETRDTRENFKNFDLSKVGIL